MRPGFGCFPDSVPPAGCLAHPHPPLLKNRVSRQRTPRRSLLLPTLFCTGTAAALVFLRRRNVTRPYLPAQPTDLERLT